MPTRAQQIARQTDTILRAIEADVPFQFWAIKTPGNTGTFTAVAATQGPAPLSFVGDIVGYEQQNEFEMLVRASAFSDVAVPVVAVNDEIRIASNTGQAYTVATVSLTPDGVSYQIHCKIKL